MPSFNICILLSDMIVPRKFSTFHPIKSGLYLLFSLFLFSFFFLLLPTSFLPLFTYMQTLLSCLVTFLLKKSIYYLFSSLNISFLIILLFLIIHLLHLYNNSLLYFISQMFYCIQCLPLHSTHGYYYIIVQFHNTPIRKL